jgi:hypothetical protein
MREWVGKYIDLLNKKSKGKGGGNQSTILDSPL